MPLFNFQKNVFIGVDCRVFRQCITVNMSEVEFSIHYRHTKWRVKRELYKESIVSKAFCMSSFKIDLFS